MPGLLVGTSSWVYDHWKRLFCLEGLLKLRELVPERVV